MNFNLDHFDAEAPPPVIVAVIENTPRRRRPGRGLVTFLTVLLIIIGVVLFMFELTRYAALFIYLPIFAVYFLAYIGFLCCVRNVDADDDELKPAALEEYLKKKKKRNRRRKQKGKHVNPTIEKDISLSDDTDFNSASPMTTAETLSLDNTDASRTEPVNNPVENLFSSVFPGISKSFEEVESQFHAFAMQINDKLRPSTECVSCRDGAHTDKSSVCVHNHAHANALAGGNEENYLPAQNEFQNNLAVPSMEDIPISSEHINLTGKYKLVHNHNFMAFLKSQGINALLRKAANASRPIHTITHEGTTLRIQVDGIIKGDSTFIIGGPPGHSNIRHLMFDDHVTYVDGGQAIQVRKVGLNAPPGGAIELIVKRQLENNGHNLIVSSKARFKDGSESLESVQTFHRFK